MYPRASLSLSSGLADTGLDYDHCMLWQRPADWFCFEPDMIEMQDLKKCPYSAIAGQKRDVPRARECAQLHAYARLETTCIRG